MTGHLRKVDPNESGSLDRFFLFEVVCGQVGIPGLRRGGRMFGGLGMQDRPGVSSVINMF